MKLRRLFLFFAALVAVLSVAGCSPPPAKLGLEVDDAEFRRGKEAAGRGEWNRALASFLAVIDARGEGNSPESQKEAGLIQLHNSKQPDEAYIRLRKYLAAKPSAPDSDLVRAQLDAAHRDMIMMFMGTSATPLDNGALQRQLTQLQKENAELREALRASGSPTVLSSGPLRSAPIESITVPGAAVQVIEPPAQAPTPLQTALGRGTGQTAAAVAPKNAAVTPAQKSTAPAAGGPTTATVLKSEGFLAVAKRVYPPPVTNADAKRIEDANKDKGPLKPGMVLRIPPR